MRQPPKDRLLADKKILYAFAKGDNKTILYMYKNYLPMVSKYVSSNGGTHEDARDVFQEALMALYKQAQGTKFVLTVSIKTYVFSICRYQWLNILRKNKKVDFLVEDFDLQDIDSSIIIHLEKAERYLLLKNHISKFKGNNRKILELHFQNYSTDEIAKQLVLSRLYVKKKKFECKKLLMKSIQMDFKYKELKQHQQKN